jgi:zinc protease
MTRSLKIPAVVAALVAVAAAPAYADDSKLAFEKYRLANGLEVILAPDTSVPLVAVNVWYHVGSGHEDHGKSGFAHLFEHMMFQGSKHVGMDKHFEILRKIGSDQINGTTNPDRTNYFEQVPSNQLEAALWLESDRMGHMLPVLDRGALDNQIDVVRNERRQRYDNVPYRRALFALYAALYPEGHPYRYLTIGKHEDLTSASVEDVTRFFKTWYVPANATLAIVGDFDAAVAKELVQKWFGGFPASKKPERVRVAPPAPKAATVNVEDPFAKQRQVTFAWHSPAAYASGDAELDIVGNALGAEGRGRLYKALVLERPLATTVRAGQSGTSFSGIFSITVTLRTGADLAEVTRIVNAEVARLAKEPLTAPEIARVVAGNEAWAIRALESLIARADVLQAYNHHLGDPGKLSWDLDRYRTATAEAIRATVARHLVPTQAVVVITNPAGDKK